MAAKGTIRQRGNSWCIRFADFERTVGHVGEMSQKEALKIGRRLYGQLSNGKPSGMTVAAFVEQKYWPTKIEGKSKAWQKTSKTIIGKYILPEFGNLHIEKLNTDMVQGFINKHKSSMSSEYVGKLANALTSITKLATRLGFRSLPVEKEHLEIPRKINKPANFLRLNQELALAKAATDDGYPQFGRLIELLAFTGLRIGEALDLEWDDVHWEPRCLSIRGTKSTAAFRSVPLMDLCAATLRRQFESRGQTSRLVFCQPNGKRLPAAHFLERWLVPKASELGFGHVTWHTFRHSFATMIDGHSSESQKLSMMGHTRSTMGARYTHPRIVDMLYSVESSVVAQGVDVVPVARRKS